jgi:protoporphyrinogen oxidase
MKPHASKAAIVGGGITGLSLAYFLLKQGIKATLFEKANHLGGVASSFRIEEIFLEKFYHHFFAEDSTAVELLEELGIQDRLYWVYPRMGFFSKSKIYPFTTPLDLLKFGPLSLPDRVRFGLFSLQTRQENDWRPLEYIPARDWLIKKLGGDVFIKLWEPLLRAKFGSHASEVPASWVWARLSARAKSRSHFSFREKLGYLAGNYKILVDTLAERIKNLGGEIELGAEQKDVPLPGFDFTAVTAAGLLPSADIKYLGNICVALKIREPFSRFYWTNIADPSIPFCVMVEHTNAFDESGYNGYRILYLSNYVDQADSIWGLSDKEVCEKYLEGLKKIKTQFDLREVAEYFVFREKYAQPLPTLGHSKKISPFRVADRLYQVSSMQIYPDDRGVNNSIGLAKRFVETFR